MGAEPGSVSAAQALQSQRIRLELGRPRRLTRFDEGATFSGHSSPWVVLLHIGAVAESTTKTSSTIRPSPIACGAAAWVPADVELMEKPTISSSNVVAALVRARLHV